MIRFSVSTTLPSAGSENHPSAGSELFDGNFGKILSPRIRDMYI